MSERKRDNPEAAPQDIFLIARHYLETEEEARREIGRRLHRDAGGGLTAGKLELARVMKLENLSREAREGLERLATLLGDLMNLIGAISQENRPGVLIDFGLEEACRWYCKQFLTETGIDVRMVSKLSGARFPTIIEAAAYRVFCEILQSARDSGAKTISVILDHTGPLLLLQFENDGLYPADTLDNWPHSKYLIPLLDGEMNAEVRPDGGVSVLCKLPCQL